MSCSICQGEEETRPYGPGGQEICFACMHADTELETQAKRQFHVLLEANEAAGRGVAVIDEEGRLRPATRAERIVVQRQQREGRDDDPQ